MEKQLNEILDSINALSESSKSVHLEHAKGHVEAALESYSRIAYEEAYTKLQNAYNSAKQPMDIQIEELKSRNLCLGEDLNNPGSEIVKLKNIADWSEADRALYESLTSQINKQTLEFENGIKGLAL